MNNYKKARIALLALATYFSVAHSSFGQSPNVLFIAVDDLRPEFNAYGQSQIVSPNLDRLASEGLTFNRAYSQYALCNPSRVSVMTGLRPSSTGVYDLATHVRDALPDVVTLGQHFKHHGYETQAIGKIYHLSQRAGDDGASWSIPYDDGQGNLDRWICPDCQPGPSTESKDVADDAYQDGNVAALALEALDSLAPEDKPFFLAVGFYKPHLPFAAPSQYWDLYDRNSIAPYTIHDWPTDSPTVAHTTSAEMKGYCDISDAENISITKAKELIHGYYACVSFIDAQVGKLLDKLDELGIRDDTIIVLWGDHGWKLSEYGAWAKFTNYEVDLRVPLIVSVPGVPANGTATNALVELVDLYPTLSDLTQLPIPDNLEGTSFSPLLYDDDLPWKKAAFSENRRSGHLGTTVRTDRYRYVQWRNLSTRVITAHELYDHHLDPDETVNVAADPAYADVVAEHRALVSEGWRAATPPSILQAGTVAQNQRDAQTWYSVSFDRPFAQPPAVVMGPMSFQGRQPATVRVRNTTVDGFEYQIDEWNYLDGAHLAEDISYLALAQGSHEFSGVKWQASQVTDARHWFKPIDFSESFSSVPLVFAQVTSVNEPDAVTTRIRSVNTSSFQAKIQEEENAADGGRHAKENLDFVAIESGFFTFQGYQIAAGGAGDAVTPAWKSFSFAQPLSGPPVLLAHMQTTDGGDTAGLRHSNLTPSGFELKVEEEASGDDELAHKAEGVGWLALAATAQRTAVFELFETSDLSAWTIRSGHWTADPNDSNKLHKENIAGDSMGLNDVLVADSTVMVEIQLDRAGAGGIQFRKAGVGDYPWESGYTAFVEMTGDVVLRTPNGELQRATTGASYKKKDVSLSVEASGENIKVYLNGRLYIDTDDSTYASGHVGLYGIGTSARFDHFTVVYP